MSDTDSGRPPLATPRCFLLSARFDPAETARFAPGAAGG